MVDLGAVLGMETTEEDDDGTGGVDIWVIDARRPWNLGNVFSGQPPRSALGELSGNARQRVPDVEHGKIQRYYRPGKGGIIVYDDGDIEELSAEKEAYFQLERLPPIEDDGQDSDGSETESENNDSGLGLLPNKKRKSWSDAEHDNGSDDEDDRPPRRRRSNSVRSSTILFYSTSRRIGIFQPRSPLTNAIFRRPPYPSLHVPEAIPPPRLKPRTVRITVIHSHLCRGRILDHHQAPNNPPRAAIADVFSASNADTKLPSTLTTPLERPILSLSPLSSIPSPQILVVKITTFSGTPLLASLLSSFTGVA